VQWTLARPEVSDPRWYAPTGYRVAYLSGRELRVVAGDGTGDHLLAGPVAHVAPAWRPGHRYQLAYVTAEGALVVRDADVGADLWSAKPGVRIRQLAWSADGRRLLALSTTRVLVYGADGRLLKATAIPRGGDIARGALAPDGHELALVTDGATRAVLVYDPTAARPGARQVLAGAQLGQVAWSPNGHWLLISWPAADQWVFVHAAGRPQIVAVSHIARGFSRHRIKRLPRIEGWCCSGSGSAS
jgi:hypothetical protein